MIRGERIYRVACAMVRALHHGRWHPARAESEARDNATVRRLAEVALDTADSTREVQQPSPCPWCEHPRHYTRCAANGCSCPTTIQRHKRPKFVMPT